MVSFVKMVQMQYIDIQIYVIQIVFIYKIHFYLFLQKWQNENVHTEH